MGRGASRVMAALSAYRCYRVGSSGQFLNVATLESANDAEAIAHAELIVKRESWCAYELWDQERKVAGGLLDRTPLPQRVQANSLTRISDGSE